MRTNSAKQGPDLKKITPIYNDNPLFMHNKYACSIQTLATIYEREYAGCRLNSVALMIN